MNRSEAAEMLRLEEQKRNIGDVRKSISLRKSAMQDALLKQTAKGVKEIQLRHFGALVQLRTLRSSQCFATML